MPLKITQKHPLVTRDAQKRITNFQSWANCNSNELETHSHT